MMKLSCGVLLLLCILVVGYALGPDIFPPLVEPLHYVVYKVDSPIDIDGKLNESAWEEVAWTESFGDIQGPSMPAPYFDTRVKMRWDDKYLYVGAYLQDNAIWANQTKHDSVVFEDNDFEIFVNPSGSCTYYKETEVNVLKTIWDLCLNKPYLNGGFPNSSFEMPGLKVGVFVDGAVNDPHGQPDKFWTVELAMPLKSLAFNDSIVNGTNVQEGDLWRINFSRVEWHVHAEGDKWVKDEDVPCENWTWSPQWSVNMHIPERWGRIEFATGQVNATTPRPDPTFHTRVCLMQTYNALVAFQAVNGYYTTNVSSLHLPNYVIDGSLHTTLPMIAQTTPWSFNITVSDTAQNLTGFLSDSRHYTWSPPYIAVRNS